MTLAVLRSILFLPISIFPFVAGDIEGHIRPATDSEQAVVQLLHDGIVVEEHFIGSDGRFAFRGLNRGSYVVRIRAVGYLDEETDVDLLQSNSHELLSIDLHRAKNKSEGPAALISVTEYQIPPEARREYEDGLEARKRGQCKQALHHLHKAIAAFEKYGEAFNELGNCFVQMKDFGKAEESFKKAVEYTSTIYPSMNLADLYKGQKRFVEAQSVLSESIATHSSEGDLYYGMALIHFAQGQMKEAEEAGLQAHQKSHRMADVHLMLAKVYVTLKMYPAVINQLRLYLGENPKGPIADRIRKSLDEVERRR